MITLELEDVEIDHCTGCGGIWLDAGELELLLGEPGTARGLLDSFKVSSARAERTRKCPICDRKMQKIVVGSSVPSLLVDKCGKGDGLWFDKGELRAMFDGATLDRDNKILKLLTDMFGHDQR